MTRPLTTTTLDVTVTVPGVHRYPGGPVHLAHPHRHLFTVTATIEVDGLKRELEFHQVQASLNDAIRLGWPRSDVGFDFDTLSCEQIAYGLVDRLWPRYPTLRAVRVAEDGENGGTVAVRS